MKRTKSQETGDIGESTTLFIASKNRDWIARKVDKDFGVDIEMELVDDEKVTGQYVKVQVKGTTKYQIVDNQIKFRIKTNFLRYCNECRVPIILVLIDVNKDIGYFIWVQEYLRIHKTNIVKHKSTDIFIPSSNDFENGLKNKIKNIASGLNHTQLQLDLKASLASAFLLGDTEIYEKLTELSIDIAKTNSLEINKIIEDLIILGNKAWGTFEGNKKSSILFNFCRKFGDKFSSSHIEKMVTRGSSYSRVGIIALGILYDEFPEYVKSLNLPEVFKKYEDIRMRYYCLFRERYLGQKSTSIWGNKEINYEIGNLNIREEDRIDLYLKWPNRGESTILDFLVYEEK
ncbi:DUF4365 domain-containing protein [Polaribacter sejongensis]|uniref:DUF4365 domain-containing protein n=1 Tax=Polaribacter sejongensis TaxID=985043 RepID=UPI0030FC8131